MASFAQWMGETAGEVTGNILRQLEHLTQLERGELEQKFLQTRAGKDLEDKGRNSTPFNREFYRFVASYALGQQEIGQVSAKVLRHPKLVFEVMAAWPDVGKSVEDTQEHLIRAIQMDGWSTFAPIMGLADDITFLNYFDALANEDNHEISWPKFKQYVDNLKKITDGVKQRNSARSEIDKQFDNDEVVIDVDGAPTSPVIILSGQTKRPVRIVLTENAIYFKSRYVPKEIFGKGSYEKIDLKDFESTHVSAPDNALFGSQMFDSEVKIMTASGMCHRLFFPSISGGQRRDMWMVSAQEVISFHRLCKRLGVQEDSKEYSTLQLVLVGGCIRLRALIPLMTQTNYLSLMPYSTILDNHPVAQSLYQFACGIDSRMAVQYSVRSQCKTPEEKSPPMIDAASLDDVKGCVSLFEALMQPTVDLLYQAHALLQWQDPFLSFFVMISFIMVAYQDWVHYLPSLALLLIAALVLRLRTKKLNKTLGPILFIDSKRSTVARIRRVKSLFEKFKYTMQRLNHALLKLHALIRSQDNEVTNQFLLALFVLAITLGCILTYVPVRYLFLLFILILFLRDCPFVEPSARRLSYYAASITQQKGLSSRFRTVGSLFSLGTQSPGKVGKGENEQDVQGENGSPEEKSRESVTSETSPGGLTSGTYASPCGRRGSLSEDHESPLGSESQQDESPLHLSQRPGRAQSNTADYNEDLLGDYNYTESISGSSIHHAPFSPWETIKWRVISWWLSIPAAPVEERSKVE